MPELRFFGQAIDGDIDLGEDGLPDIVVGSQGMAIILRYWYHVYQSSTTQSNKRVQNWRPQDTSKTAPCGNSLHLQKLIQFMNHKCHADM